MEVFSPSSATIHYKQHVSMFLWLHLWAQRLIALVVKTLFMWAKKAIWSGKMTLLQQNEPQHISLTPTR